MYNDILSIYGSNHYLSWLSKMHLTIQFQRTATGQAGIAGRHVPSHVLVEPRAEQDHVLTPPLLDTVRLVPDLGMKMWLATHRAVLVIDILSLLKMYFWIWSVPLVSVHSPHGEIRDSTFNLEWAYNSCGEKSIWGINTRASLFYLGQHNIHKTLYSTETLFIFNQHLLTDRWWSLLYVIVCLYIYSSRWLDFVDIIFRLHKNMWKWHKNKDQILHQPRPCPRW